MTSVFRFRQVSLGSLTGHAQYSNYGTGNPNVRCVQAGHTQAGNPTSHVPLPPRAPPAPAVQIKPVQMGIAPDLTAHHPSAATLPNGGGARALCPGFFFSFLFENQIGTGIYNTLVKNELIQ
jgi:hypothetical protein